MIPPTAILLLSIPLALAQYGGPAPDPTSSSSSSAAPSSTDSSSTSIQTVTVGKDGAIAFNPSTITAAKGSQVEFIFFQPSHSVVQASFDKPCEPISDSGFFSGAFSTTGSGPNANSFTLTINDTNPLWFFCGFPTHCETGMVGVINPPSDKSQTLDQFKSAASKVSSTTDPKFSAQGGIVGPVKAASSGGSSTTSAAPAASSTGSAAELKGSMAWAGLFVTFVTGWGIAGLMG